MVGRERSHEVALLVKAGYVEIAPRKHGEIPTVVIVRVTETGTKLLHVLENSLYTEGANPMALEFYKMMQSEGAGGKISKIELVDLSPEDAKKAAEMQDGPGGQKMKLPLTPTKKLKITVETKSDEGKSSSSSENFVAEKDGKFVIPVPANAK